jgi:DNA-binding response OmpR family regulator
MSRVLLVEDDVTMRSLLKTLLELEGFETHAFGTIDVGELIDHILSYQPSVVLLDVHLQNASGLDVLKMIRQHSELVQLPVAMISGEDLATECLSAGADKFILKPFDSEDLIQWVKQNGYE